MLFGALVEEKWEKITVKGENAHENVQVLSDDAVGFRVSDFGENGHFKKEYGGQKSKHR